jgi:preprotein translocase subunit YajC
MDRFLIGIAQAQDGGGGGGAGAGGGNFMSMIFLLGAFFLIFYFLILRPQQRRQKEMQRMISALKRGDRILTSGGLYGTVWDVKEDLLVVKLTEDLKVEIAKSAVQGVVSQTGAGQTAVK